MTTPTILNAAERDALAAALDDEYKSRETYAQVIRDFGELRPFINIVEAEARHIEALLALFKRYGIAAAFSVPAVTGARRTRPRPSASPSCNRGNRPSMTD